MIRFGLMALFASTAAALEYPYPSAEPQKSGWPLTAEERTYGTLKKELFAADHIHLSSPGMRCTRGGCGLLWREGELFCCPSW